MYPAETLAIAAMTFFAFPVVGGLLAGVLSQNQRWIRQSATVLMRTVQAKIQDALREAKAKRGAMLDPRGRPATLPLRLFAFVTASGQSDAGDELRTSPFPVRETLL